MKEEIIVIISCEVFSLGATATIINKSPVEVILHNKIIENNNDIKELNTILEDYNSVGYFFSFLGENSNTAPKYIQEFYNELLENDKKVKILKGDK